MFLNRYQNLGVPKLVSGHLKIVVRHFKLTWPWILKSLKRRGVESPDIGMVEGITVHILVSHSPDAVGALQLVSELTERSKTWQIILLQIERKFDLSKNGETWLPVGLLSLSYAIWPVGYTGHKVKKTNKTVQNEKISYSEALLVLSEDYVLFSELGRR